MDQQEFTPQQYKKYNGQSIMLALENMGGSATADDLAEHIGVSINQPQHIVKAEVMQVLRRGISNGFFQRRGKSYFLFNGETYEEDNSRKRKSDSSLQYQTDGGRKRKHFTPLNDEQLKSDLEEHSIEGLQEIIAKANEETQIAAILATKAAERAKLASMKILEMVENQGSGSDE